MEVCREANLSEVTFPRWKNQFGQMEVSEAKANNITNTPVTKSQTNSPPDSKRRVHSRLYDNASFQEQGEKLINSRRANTMDRRKVAPRLESFGRWAFLIGAGIFATTLAQPDNLDLPLQRLLKDDLQTSQQLMAAFFALAALPWYLKPLAGLLSDTVPFFGTRRRYYLIWSAVFAAVLWFLVGHVPRSYTLLLCAVMATNAMLVVGSTIVGGLLVEAGPRLGAAGRLVAVQSVVESACTLVAGPLAGILAGQPFEVATAVGGSIALTVAPIAFIWLN